MSHLEHDDLLRLVDGPPDDSGVVEESRRHLESCAQCRAELTTMTRVRAAGTALAAEPALGTLTRPPAGVWEAIQGELDVPASPPPSVTPVPADPVPARRRRTWLVVAASVAVGAVLGGSVVALAGRDDTSAVQQTVRVSRLEPLAGHTTSGTLVMTGRPTRQSLSVKLNEPDSGSGFLEVWLLDARTGGMVSLGVLDGDRGSYAVPSGINLSAYDQVDVSREPYDGNPAHSKVSLARGPVPGD